MKSCLFILLSVCFVALTPSVTRAQDCLSGRDVPGCTHGLPTDVYNGLLGQMQANPAPAVRQIEIDSGDIHRYSYYKLLGDHVKFYDAPNGHELGEIDPGYTYTDIITTQGDWVQLQSKLWVRSKNITGVPASSYAGVAIDNPLPFPMAWIIQPVKPSPVPGLKPDVSTHYMPRYTRVYLYTSVHVGNWDWYLIGPGQWVEQRKVGKVSGIAKPGGAAGRWVAVDLYEQVLTAYEGDRPVYATLISSGLRQWSTREGLFTIGNRYRADTMTGAMGQVDFYYLPKVPYVMYFDQLISLHGTYWHDRFGYKQSHGCVNLSISDARWLFEWTSGGASVYVFRSR